jgi:uncharacterized protein YdbL (DUF1318 family)
MIRTLQTSLAFIARALVFAAVLAVAVPALALDLDQVRASGAVGERPDGLVGVVKGTATPDVAALVETINRERLEAYKALAAKEGTQVTAVQAVAGEKQIAKARQNGWYWMDAGGAWRK